MEDAGPESLAEVANAVRLAVEELTEIGYELHKVALEQNERLRKIWWALFAIWAPIILIFGFLWFGWFNFEFVTEPLTE